MRKPLYCCPEYIVDSDGYVLSKRFGTPLKHSINIHGYAVINISINGKPKGLTVHNAVAHTFLENDYQEGLQVNHKDGNKLNNSANNLEWVNNQENRTHAVKDFLHLQGEDCPYAKLNWEAVDYIRANPDHLLQRELGEMFGVSRSTIGDIIHYRTWKHRPEN